MESELFGHVRGAFSGAVQDRMGVFEEADGGTLFFDEIGEIPLALQRKLSANAEQRVDSVLAGQIASAAEALAAEAVSSNVAHFVPCSPEPDEQACAAQFIETFGARAFRRPLEAAEKDALFAVYDVGREGAAFEDGVRLVVTAVLQSASLRTRASSPRSPAPPRAPRSSAASSS